MPYACAGSDTGIYSCEEKYSIWNDAFVQFCLWHGPDFDFGRDIQRHAVKITQIRPLDDLGKKAGGGDYSVKRSLFCLYWDKEILKMKKFFGTMVMLSTFLLLSAPVLSAKDALLAPDFTLQDTQGNKIKLADYRDKQPVLLFFWTTWCPFCREELKGLNGGRYADLTKIGWKIMVIDVGESASHVNDFTKKNPLVFNVLLDTDSAVSYIYDVLGVPTYVLIDKGGRIAFQGNALPTDYEKLLSK